MSKWLSLAKELSALAKTGIFYTKDIYDYERFERINEISHEIMSELLNSSPERIANMMENEKGYQTPKIDTRGVVWKDGKVLLVREKDGLWALPGGWMDVTQTISSNVKKEIREEAGCEVSVGKMIAIHSRNLHNSGQNIFEIEKIFIECNYVSGEFKSNSETIDMQFFDVNHLPELCENKTSYEQVALAYEAYLAGSQWLVKFD